MLSVSTVITRENYALQSAELSESLNIPRAFEGSQIRVCLITQS
jgi:hypothetical protein